MPPRSAPRWLLAATAAIGLLAGCSADDTTSSSSSSASSTSAAASIAPPTAPASAPPTGVPPTGVPARPSAGCGHTQPAPGRTDEVVVSGTDTRGYVRYVPVGIDPGVPAPLVLDITAYSPASLEEAFSGFATTGADGTVKADDEGFIVATPEPVNGDGALLTWNYVGTEGWSDDVAFITDLLDDIEADACVDTARVFVAGFAVGGVFASIIACSLSPRFAALATVAGLFFPGGCEPSEPLPVISFHGTGDRFVPFDGGVGAGPASLPLSAESIRGLTFMTSRAGAVESSSAWATKDGCASEPVESPVVDGVSLRRWSGCDGAVAVDLFVIDGGEHTWPGSTGMDAYTELLGPVSRRIDATDLIWEFFVDQTS